MGVGLDLMLALTIVAESGGPLITNKGMTASDGASPDLANVSLLCGRWIATLVLTTIYWFKRSYCGLMTDLSHQVHTGAVQNTPSC
jgi:hypothetical protein